MDDAHIFFWCSFLLGVEDIATPMKFVFLCFFSAGVCFFWTMEVNDNIVFLVGRTCCNLNPMQKGF